MTPSDHARGYTSYRSAFSATLKTSPAQLLDAHGPRSSMSPKPPRGGRSGVGRRPGERALGVSHGTGLNYHFLPFGEASAAGKGAAGGVARQSRPGRASRARIGLPRDVLSLASLAPGDPIILQDHASKTAPPLAARAVAPRNVGRRWGRVLRRHRRSRSPLPACSIRHTPVRDSRIDEPLLHPATSKRRAEQTGVEGDPAILWVGHLDANKDPLTVLKGVSAAARDLPRLRLFCCFGTAPLLGDVQWISLQGFAAQRQGSPARASAS
jgi:hypothetical protein